MLVRRNTNLHASWYLLQRFWMELACNVKRGKREEERKMPRETRVLPPSTINRDQSLGIL